MVTYVQKKLIKVTIIVDISIIGFNAHCRPSVSKALFIRYQLATFFSIRTIVFILFFYGWTVRRLCVYGKNLGQRKHNEFRACALLVPNVRLALV